MNNNIQQQSKNHYILYGKNVVISGRTIIYHPDHEQSQKEEFLEYYLK